jgi:hypothetical protein
MAQSPGAAGIESGLSLDRKRDVVPSATGFTQLQRMMRVQDERKKISNIFDSRRPLQTHLAHHHVFEVVPVGELGCHDDRLHLADVTN